MATPAPVAATPEYVVPDGIDLQQTSGKVTGRPMFKVRGFEMPWAGTEQEAVGLHSRLKAAFENGYYCGGSNKPPKPATTH